MTPTPSEALADALDQYKSTWKDTWRVACPSLSWTELDLTVAALRAKPHPTDVIWLRNVRAYLNTALVEDINPTISKRTLIAQIDAALASSPAAGTDSSEVTYKIGRWLSAALDDPKVCQEMKNDILAWMDAGKPNNQPTESVSSYVENYRFEFEDGRQYTPNEQDKAMLEDAIEGFRALASTPPASPAPSECDEGDHPAGSNGDKCFACFVYNEERETAPTDGANSSGRK